MNKEDLDQLYNLQVPGLKARQADDFSTDVDEKSKAYLYKVQELREKQRNLLPLFLQSKRIVQRHKRCLSTILAENEEHIPYQLQTVIDKGQEGLKSYSDLLENVDQVLKKNQELTDQLQRYQKNLHQVKQKLQATEAYVEELTGADKSAQQTQALQQIEQAKGRIQDLLSGMFENIDNTGQQ